MAESTSLTKVRMDISYSVNKRLPPLRKERALAIGVHSRGAHAPPLLWSIDHSMTRWIPTVGFPQPSMWTSFPLSITYSQPLRSEENLAENQAEENISVLTEIPYHERFAKKSELVHCLHKWLWTIFIDSMINYPDRFFSKHTWLTYTTWRSNRKFGYPYLLLAKLNSWLSIIAFIWFVCAGWDNYVRNRTAINAMSLLQGYEW